MMTEVRFFGGRYSVEYEGALDIAAEVDRVRFEGVGCRLKYLGPDIVQGPVEYWHGVVLDPWPWEAK